MATLNQSKSPQLGVKKAPGKGKSGQVTIRTYTTTVVDTATKALEQAPVSPTPHDLWMKHIINTPNFFLKDIIIAFASSIISEDIHHNDLAMIEILENHNYGAIQKRLKTLDPIVDINIHRLLRDHREVANYKHIATKTQFDENLFIDDIAKYISEAMGYLQHSLVAISRNR